MNPQTSRAVPQFTWVYGPCENSRKGMDVQICWRMSASDDLLHVPTTLSKCLLYDTHNAWATLCTTPHPSRRKLLGTCSRLPRPHKMKKTQAGSTPARKSVSVHGPCRTFRTRREDHGKTERRDGDESTSTSVPCGTARPPERNGVKSPSEDGARRNTIAAAAMGH